MLTDKKIREIRSNVSARPKLVSQTRAGPPVSAHPVSSHPIISLLGTNNTTHHHRQPALLLHTLSAYQVGNASDDGADGGADGSGDDDAGGGGDGNGGDDGKVRMFHLTWYVTQSDPPN